MQTNAVITSTSTDFPRTGGWCSQTDFPRTGGW